MVQRIDLTGRVFNMLKENNLMIEKYQSRRRREEWMLRHDVPGEWSNNVADISDQQYKLGYPILGPVEEILEETENGMEHVFRFPTEGELNTQKIDQLIENQGTDALAWYRPYHMDPQERWGITILDRGIWSVARKIATKMFSEPYTANQIQLCRNIAKNFLYYHEMFHFKVELAATMMELIEPSEPVYAQYWVPQERREWFRSEVKSNPYVKAPLEEALANSYALHKTCSLLEEGRGKVKKAIVSFIKTQPDGYKNAWRLSVGGDKWIAAINELINKLLDATDHNHFSPRKILASHLLFDGAQGKEDWIEEYYEGIVPCRILDTGFAQGLFSKSGRIETPRLGVFCMTNRCAKEYDNAPKGIQDDLIKAVTQDWLESEGTFSLQSKQRRQYKPVSKGAKWNSNPKRVREFYLQNKQDQWRAYEEKYHPTNERILRKMHRKATKNKQSKEIEKLKKKITPDKITHHNEQCITNKGGLR